jgi:protein subunit release factor A
MDDQVKRSRRFSFSLFKSRRSQEPEADQYSTSPPLYVPQVEAEGSVPSRLLRKQARRASTAEAVLFPTPMPSSSSMPALPSPFSDDFKDLNSGGGLATSTGSISAPPSGQQKANVDPPKRRSTGSVRLRNRATVSFEGTNLNMQLQAMEETSAASSLPGISRRRSTSGSGSSLPGLMSGKLHIGSVRRPSLAEAAHPPELKRSTSWADIRRLARQEPEGKHYSMEVDLKKAEEERQQREKRPLRTSRSVPEHVRKRNLVINEIISTEQDYINDLGVMITVFRNPMLEEVATKEEVNVLFSNIQQLIEVNKMLLTDMVQRVKETNGDELGDSFLLLGDYLKMYSTYCSNQSVSREMLDKCRKESKLFKAFLQRASQDPRTNHLMLRDYLIKPVQRICKYPLLLRELLKCTESSHPDHEKLTSALEKIQNVVASVNEKKQHEEEMTAIAKVLAQLRNPEMFRAQLMAPGRKSEYFQEGTLLEASLDGQQFFPRHYFLFSDHLIITNGQPNQKPASAHPTPSPPPGFSSSTKKNQAKLDVVSVLPLGQANVNCTLSDTAESRASTLEIHSNDAIYVLPFTSLELKKRWAQRHAAAVAAAAAAQDSPRSRKFSVC